MLLVEDYSFSVRWARDEKERLAWIEATRWSSLGIYMFLCVGACSYLGLLADRKWGGGVVWTIVGFFLGVATAFYGVFRELRRLPRDD